MTRSIRDRMEMPEGVSIMECDPTKPGHWQEKAADYEVIINLAGATIFRHWSSKAKHEILYSRILATRNLIEAMAGRKNKETHFLSVSGIGYYGFRGEDILDEGNPSGYDFLAWVAAQWESAALCVQELGVRLVICRLGHVFGLGGGVLPKLILLSRIHLGSQWGNGLQWTSWIHEDDVAEAFLFLLAREDITGPVNITTPEPVRNTEMMRVLCRFIKAKPLIPRVPGFVLRLMAGEFATVFVNGQRVVPRRLINSGFAFKYATLSEALCSLMKQGNVYKEQGFAETEKI